MYEIGVGKQPTVGRDLSPPLPIDRPVGNPPPTPMSVLQLMIGFRLLDDDGATGRSIDPYGWLLAYTYFIHPTLDHVLTGYTERIMLSV